MENNKTLSDIFTIINLVLIFASIIVVFYHLFKAISQGTTWWKPIKYLWICGGIIILNSLVQFLILSYI